MKKMKFATGLILTMLFLASNFVNAEIVPFDGTLPHSDYDHKMNISFKINANPSFGTPTAIWAGQRTGEIFSGGTYVRIFNFPSGTIDKDDWIHSYDTAYYVMYNDEKIDHHYGIMFRLRINYKDGKDLIPVIKRTIVLGEWYCEIDDDDPSIRKNKMNKTDVVLTGYDLLLEEYRYDFTGFDRKTGTAIYFLSDNLNSLASKYPIYSVSYEVSLVDEIDYINSSVPYGPPGMALPENMRGLTFEIEGNGISTDIPINLNGNTLYVPSNKNYQFTVTSANSIIVTTNRTGIYSTEGVEVIKQTGSIDKYDVTIKRVQSNFNVKIAANNEAQSGTGDDGTTGNIGPEDDAVWASNGILYIKTVTPGQMSIYSIDGKFHKTIEVSGSYSLSIPKGFYVVKLNGKVYKVIL